MCLVCPPESLLPSFLSLPLLLTTLANAVGRDKFGREKLPPGACTACKALTWYGFPKLLIQRKKPQTNCDCLLVYLRFRMSRHDAPIFCYATRPHSRHFKFKRNRNTQHYEDKDLLCDSTAFAAIQVQTAPKHKQLRKTKTY